MASAYVLVNCDLGFEAEKIDEIKQLEDVKEVHGVFGAYDILVKVESAKVENLREAITLKIRRLNRVKSTLTLLIIEELE